ARVADDDPAGQNHDLDTLADQAPGHRVAVRVEIDRTVSLNLTDQIPQLPERGAVGQRAQRKSFVGKALRRRNASGAVFTLVGNLAHPTGPDAPRRLPSSRTGARRSRSS